MIVNNLKKELNKLFSKLCENEAYKSYFVESNDDNGLDQSDTVRYLNIGEYKGINNAQVEFSVSKHGKVQLTLLNNDFVETTVTLDNKAAIENELNAHVKELIQLYLLVHEETMNELEELYA